MTGREPVTGVGTGAAGVGAVGLTVGVGVAVGVSWQVQVGDGGGGGGVVVQLQVGESVGELVSVDAEVDAGDVGCSLRGAASAECEANSTVKLVATSVMLANPAIFARLVIFNAVTRCLLGCEEIGHAVSEAQAVAPLSPRRDALVSRRRDTRA